jgi:hypothetical protein
MPNYSSKKETIRTLAGLSAADARSFLSELANLRDEKEAVRRFVKRFIGLWPQPGRFYGLIAENIDSTPGSRPESEQIQDLLGEHWIPPLREALRAVWTAPDSRTRAWGILRILDEFVFQEDPGASRFWPLRKHPGTVTRLPVPTTFEQALIYLLHDDARTEFCANVGCPAPYFFAIRRGQKYCSDSCALPAQREFKRTWWANHGNQWRTKRAKKRLRKRRR